MKNQNLLIGLFGILFWAGHMGVFKFADLFLYPMFIASIIIVLVSEKYEKFEKYAFLSTIISISTYLLLWLMMKWGGLF